MLRRVLRDRRWRWALATVALVAGIAFLYALRAVLPPFVLAAFIAYAVYPAVDALHRQGLAVGPSSSCTPWAGCWWPASGRSSSRPSWRNWRG